MPLSIHSQDSLADNGQPTFLAFWGSTLGAFGLAIYTPRIAVFLDVAHALLEGVAAFSAEEVAEVPVFTKGNHVLPKDRGLAMLAFRGVNFVPVEMAEVAKSRVTVFGHGETVHFWKMLATFATLDAVETLGSFCWGLLEDFECFKAGTAGEADEALGVVFFWGSTKTNYATFDGHLALMASCGGSSTCSRRPVTSWNWRSCMMTWRRSTTSCLWVWKWSLRFDLWSIRCGDGDGRSFMKMDRRYGRV